MEERMDRAEKRIRKMSEALKRSHLAITNAKAEELLQRDETYGALIAKEEELRQRIHQCRLNLSKKQLKLRRLARDLQQLSEELSSVSAAETGAVREYIVVQADAAAKLSEARVSAAAGLVHLA